jgi:hypothetical protein
MIDDYGVQTPPAAVPGLNQPWLLSTHHEVPAFLRAETERDHLKPVESVVQAMVAVVGMFEVMLARILWTWESMKNVEAVVQLATLTPKLGFESLY